ncbi:MAG: hypothetical protein II811_06970 [Spirochaetaceae bacterium]|nr:hypothetical protein [Spirochaetaceae bacterium]
MKKIIAVIAAAIIIAGCSSTSEIVYDEQDAGIGYTNLEVKMLGDEADLYLYSTNSEAHPFALSIVEDDEDSSVIPWLIFLGEKDLNDIADKLDMLISESASPIVLRKVLVEDKNNGIVFQRSVDEGDTVYSLITYRSRLVNMGSAKEPKWEVKYVETGHYPIKTKKIAAIAQMLRKNAGGAMVPEEDAPLAETADTEESAVEEEVISE